ncbi:stability determinant [Burkholderia sp. Bp8986]|uniref:type II toxin-antitoxin system RelB family antitoxin n=1 Tax=Burkholderia sp. Bp8986 TaxID=2184550 RepID=UPI000F5929B3|nr:stability determinant [Burkholderia sp. Bp8986]
MNVILSPIESEFPTAAEAEAYDSWFRAKVQASLADTRPSVPHDQVMADIEAIIRAAELKQAAIRS